MRASLGEVAQIVMGQSPPGTTVSEEGGIALLNGPTEFGSYHPAPAQYTTDPRKFAEPGDLLFCVRGSTTGRMNWADQKYAIGRGIAAIRHRDDPSLQPFIRGVIEIELSELLAQATGSTFPNVSATQLAELPFPNLDRGEQKAIAHILGTLDAKIELNRRMARTLEEMARAIFQDWFVDFGPTRAKMEEQEPYLPPELWNLFPDELVDSGLGEIPDGWEEGELSRVATFPVRTVKPQEIPIETAYIGLEHMPRKSVSLYEWETAKKVTSNKLSFHKGEFLFGKLRPYFHKVGIAPTDGICSTDIVVVAPKKISWSSFVILCISTEEFVAYTDQTSNGTRMPRTNWKTMGHYEICLPPEPVAGAFQELVQHLLSRTVTNIPESRVLSAQRDTLLPQMVAGKVAVEERAVKHAL